MVSPAMTIHYINVNFFQMLFDLVKVSTVGCLVELSDSWVSRIKLVAGVSAVTAC